MSEEKRVRFNDLAYAIVKTVVLLLVAAVFTVVGERIWATFDRIGAVEGAIEAQRSVLVEKTAELKAEQERIQEELDNLRRAVRGGIRAIDEKEHRLPPTRDRKRALEFDTMEQIQQKMRLPEGVH